MQDEFPESDAAAKPPYARGGNIGGPIAFGKQAPLLLRPAVAATDGAQIGTAASGDRALVVRLVEIDLPVDLPDGTEIAVVSLAGGRVTATPALWAIAGASRCTLLVEEHGADANGNGLPDALDAALGSRPLEDVPLLTILYVSGQLVATTPYGDLFDVEGAPAPPGSVPATWQFVVKLLGTP
jgi:hypothetical protein